MYFAKIESHFDSAHHLENYKGACANQHGHTYLIQVVIKSEKLIDDMSCDFKVIKKTVNEIIEQFDHKNLNEVLDYNPTAENMVQDIYKQLHYRFYGKFSNVQLYSVELWEGLGTSILYKEEN